MTTRGVVRFWSDDAGWGVIDSLETPGGCWTHFSHVSIDGYRTLTAGEAVDFEWEVVDQDGYAYRTIEARVRSAD